MADTLTRMRRWACPIMGNSPCPPRLPPTGRPSLLTQSKGIKPHLIILVLLQHQYTHLPVIPSHLHALCLTASIAHTVYYGRGVVWPGNPTPFSTCMRCMVERPGGYLELGRGSSPTQGRYCHHPPSQPPHAISPSPLSVTEYNWTIVNHHIITQY